MARLRYLLLQVRRDDDPMRDQEVRCFARWLGCEPRDIDVADLLVGTPGRDAVDAADALLFGGSGDYSAADDNDWIDRTLATLRQAGSQSTPRASSPVNTLQSTSSMPP